jgi:hypothetical protein
MPPNVIQEAFLSRQFCFSYNKGNALSTDNLQSPCLRRQAQIDELRGRAEQKKIDRTFRRRKEETFRLSPFAFRLSSIA